MLDLKTAFLIATLLFAANPTVTQAEGLPQPVHGVTFEEWAAAAARLADNRDKSEVLKTLAIDDAAFEEVNSTFTQALKDDKDFKLINLYGQAFSNPNAGRFGTGAAPVEYQRKLVTFDDYARLYGHMEAASKAGADPQAVLAEHGLTVFEYSQDGAYWVQKMREQSLSGDTAAINAWNAELARYEAEYAARYAKK
ncbi:hypothetical protein [Neorhizobium alkalisoli]|uniref:hypothetical protein n=1 Tax=Neorhizobium alkalisoli TaxID=528178 RepID=UPI000CFA0101|nr:hypothetical protein [Neorhizobium alkalisoli]